MRAWLARLRQRLGPIYRWPLLVLGLGTLLIIVGVYYLTVGLVFKWTPFWRDTTYAIPLDRRDVSCDVSPPTVTCPSCSATVASPSTLILDDGTRKTTVVLFGISTLPQSHPLGDAASKALTAAVQHEKVSCAPGDGDHVCSVDGLDLREVVLAAGLATVPWYLAPSQQGGIPSGASACSSGDAIRKVKLSARLTQTERDAQHERVGLWWDWNPSWDVRERDPLLWRQGRDGALAGLEAVEASRGQAVATLFTGIAAVLSVLGFVSYKRFTLGKWTEHASTKQSLIIAELVRLREACRRLAAGQSPTSDLVAEVRRYRDDILAVRSDFDTFVETLSSDKDAFLLSREFSSKLQFVTTIANYVRSKGEEFDADVAGGSKHPTPEQARAFAAKIVTFMGPYDDRLR